MAELSYSILGSGSSANSYVFQFKGKLFVVDNGYSNREFQRRLLQCGFDTNEIELVFITHGHGDHIKGIERLCHRNGIPIVTHQSFPLERYFKKSLKRLEIEPDKIYDYNHLQFKAFTLHHDAPCSLGYHFNFDGTSITIITDTGKVNEQMFHAAMNSDILFLESNYSKSMLSEGPYPEHLKRRISSNQGHLSNEDAALFMEDLYRSNSRLKQIYLCHLSKNNNSPEKVREEVELIYSGDIPWRICRHGEMVCSPELELRLIP